MGKAVVWVGQVIPQIMESGFKGIFVVITNPVDTMTYLVQKLSGLTEKQVIGTGTSIDSARLRYFLAGAIKVDPRSMEAFCMGEHGDTQMIPWSQITVGAKRIEEILADSPGRFTDIKLNSLQNNIASVGTQMMQEKGSTTSGLLP